MRSGCGFIVLNHSRALIVSLLAGFQWKQNKTSVRWMKTALSLVFTDTDYLKYLFPQFVKSNLYHICYTAIGQRISICNYWNGETPRNNLLTLYYLLTVFRIFIWPLSSSFRPSPQRPVCEQQWLFGFAQQWESQSKLNRSAHPLWVKLIRKFKCVTITECSNDLMSPEKKYYQGGEGCLQSCTGLQKAVSDSVLCLKLRVEEELP